MCVADFLDLETGQWDVNIVQAVIGLLGILIVREFFPLNQLIDWE
jgi:hypothetical protein